MSKRKDELGTEAKAARQRVVGTVGELATAVALAKQEAVGTARRYAPLAGGVVAGLVLLKLQGLTRRRG